MDWADECERKHVCDGVLPEGYKQHLIAYVADPDEEESKRLIGLLRQQTAWEWA